ncbi:hypothetical protein [Saccharomonospora viridis]|jgi:Mce-associated membrane protein|uniref:Mce-associated membrane protein n=1 Tax=Saccharomonospora viridis TaxID=1852 RepID=A0A837DC77_9PSEU|nr:hypothetical protein [Saccharomonospora viridis]KHF45090.1 hypothetical protein MINT15_19720 [Saccharomonospora viridis]SFP13684.1 Mce-associated membrane protein [Saccharomonospora viridis]
MSSEDQRPEPDDAEDRPATEPDIDTADESSAEGRWADGSGADGPDAPDDSDASENGENEGSEEDAEAAKNPKGDKTGSSKDTEGERRPTRSGPPRPLLFTVAALASAALVVAIVFGVMWRNAAGSDELKIAEARDEVTATANRAAAVFLEFDHTRSDELLAERKKLSTDEMSEEIDETEQEWRDSIEEAQLKTVATVQDVAVEELNVHEGKARALAVVQIEVTNKQGSFTNVERLQLELEREQQGDESDGDRQWKVSALANVQYGASG